MFERFKHIFSGKLMFSLRYRILLLGGLGVLFAMSMIVVFSYFTSNQYIRNTNVSKIKSMSDEYAILINKEIETPLIITRTIAQAFAAHENIPETSRRQSMNGMIRNVLEQNQSILSLWIIAEPNALDNLDVMYAKPEINLKGQYIQSFYRLNGIIKEEEDYENDETELDFEDYYVLPKTFKREVLLNPYYYSYTDNVYDQILETSIVVPIMKNGKFLGVVGCDISLEYFQSFFKDKMLDENAFFWLISNNGTLVSHPNSKKVGTNLVDNNSYIDRRYKIIENIQDGKTFSFFADTINTSKSDRFFINFVPVTIGKTETPWSLAVIVPSQHISADVRSQLWNSVIFGLFLFFTLYILIIYIARKLITPLKSIEKTLSKLAVGQLVEAESLQNFSSKEIQNIAGYVNKLISGLNITSAFVKEIGRGNLDAQYTPLSKTDVLGNSIAEMRDSLLKKRENETDRKVKEENERWINEGLASFSELLRRAEKIDDWGYEIISSLVQYVNANQGGLYVYNDVDKNNVYLELAAMFAYNRKRYEKQKVALDNGLLGACALEKKTIFITKVPDDYIDISSGLGQGRPTCLLIVPLIMNEIVYGVIEMASFTTLRDFEINFVEKIAGSIAATIQNTRVNKNTTNLLEISEKQASEKEEREKELKQTIEIMVEAQEKAKKREFETIGILNALNNAALVAEFDLSGCVIDVNPEYCSLLRKKSIDLLGLSHNTIFPVNTEKYDFSNKFWEEIKRGKIKKVNFNFEIDERIIWISGTYAPIFNEHNQVLRILNIATDISESKNKEKEIHKLLIEAQERAEQLSVQEQEMMNSFEEFVNIQNQFDDNKASLETITKEKDKLEKETQFFKNEFEKTLKKNKLKEQSLRHKIKNLEEELKKYKS